MVLVAPSLLAADVGNLQSQVQTVEKAGADWLHFDIMDGHFVPNLSFGPHFVKQMRKISSLFFDVHLMVENPEQFVKMFENCGADMITVHYEACDNIPSLVAYLKERNIAFGLSLKPQTKAKVLKPFLDIVDNVLVMTVEPGFGGQQFMRDQLDKISEIKQMRQNRKFHIETDGGINLATAPLCVDAGADILVAGNAIFTNNAPENIIKQFHRLGEKSWQP